MVMLDNERRIPRGSSKAGRIPNKVPVSSAAETIGNCLLSSRPSRNLPGFEGSWREYVPSGESSVQMRCTSCSSKAGKKYC